MAAHYKPRLVSVGATPVDFAITQDLVAIGSAPGNDLVIADKTVSRRHATIARLDGRAQLADLGSTNGTSVNGARIAEPVELNDGDEISFGNALFRFSNPVIAPARNARSSYVITFIVIALLVGAAAFGINQYLVNFNRLQEASETPSMSTRTGSTPPAPANHVPSIAIGGASIPVAPLHPLIPSPLAAPPASPDATVYAANPADDSWLIPLNRYRKSAGLEPVPANPRFSRGDYLHSRYVVRNFGKEIAARANLGIGMHLEDPSKPWYTAEGRAAGIAGDVDEMWNPRGDAAPSWAIDNWMQSPFHRLPILNPHLHSVGYASVCEHGVCIASLNLESDIDPILSAPAPLSAPIEYPPGGATIKVKSFDGEWPDPLSSCPGYTLPSGFPITIQLGSMVNPGVASYSLKRTEPARATLDACVFDGSDYNNSDPGTQAMIRNQLSSFGAIVIMPRTPFTAGSYVMTIDAGGHEYSWPFAVE
jgi:pSer/pThr/pTyr-binding forkhead associated (FHA) protein